MQSRTKIFRTAEVPSDAVFGIARRQGLYDPEHESDSCGVAMVTDIQGRRSHAIVADGLTALEHLEHRGAAGAEPNSGDGAGILLQLPVELLREVVDFELPPTAPDGANTFAAGICFLPQDPVARAAAREHVEAIADEEGLEVLGWREVPVDPDGAEVGVTALGCMPYMAQLFVAAPQGSSAASTSTVGSIRCASAPRRNGVYFPSLSSRTMVYKGMLTTMQLPQYFPDLRDERCVSAIAIVHSRFSTNTFPSWPLAHPFRFVAHNGEINTVRGNRNRMHAREAMLASAKIPGDLSRLSPICTPEASDSASFDEVLELLHLGGRSLPHAVLMMIPEAWENNTTMDPAERAFWQFHASLMEPWDGPACVTFTDGTLVGAVLDRNGLRPGRWWRTIDDRIILASESGVLDVPSAEIVAKGRLQPGKMFLIDTAAGRIVSDDEIKEEPAPDRGPTESGCTPDCSTSRRCPTACACSRTTSPSCAARSPSATPRKTCASCSPRWPPRVPSRWARWAPTPRPPCCRSGPGCSTTTSSNSSPR